MAREINDIKKLIIAEKDKRLELKELNSDSKVSVFNAWAYIIAVVIHGFEVILDIFKVDIDESIRNRVNGTPGWYVNRIKEYQEGDALVISPDGMTFGYEQIDIKKRIITRAAYQEAELAPNALDKLLILKVATGEAANLQPITPEQVVQVSAFMEKVRFAGTNLQVVSRKGDILVPRLTIFHDGALDDRTMRNNINEAIHNFILNMSFDSTLYITQLYNAILEVDHVTDIWEDPSLTLPQGIHVVSFDEGGNVIKNAQHPDGIMPVNRIAVLASGFLRESNGDLDAEGDEIANFDDSITLSLEQ